MSIPVSEIEQILKSNPDYAILVDEAYVDFGGESCYRLINQYDNLLVCRTFSKSWSMAGARLGYAIGSTDLISDLNRIKFSTNPYSINRLSMVAGIAAVDSYDYFKSNCAVIAENRAYTIEKLNALGFETLPGQANFILTRYSGTDGNALYQKLKSKGVLVRHWNQPRIKDYLRITIGSREQMDILLQTLSDILKGA